MAKRKKKKDLDFQKVKIKVGRRLKRDIKETKAEFSTRKLVLKEIRSYSDDPISALSNHSDHISHQGKLSLLNHFNAALTPDVTRSLTKPIIDSLSKFLIDPLPDVRGAAIKCLRTCFNRIRQQNLSTKEFVMNLKPYLDCAFTHISTGVVDDCQRFLDHLVNSNDPQIFEPLMMIILRRIEAGSASSTIHKLALKVKTNFLRHKQKESFSKVLGRDSMKPLIWTQTNYLLDLDPIIHIVGQAIDQEREYVLNVNNLEPTNVVEKYLELVKDETILEDSNPVEVKRRRRF